jgi:hypothetical protein
MTSGAATLSPKLPSAPLVNGLATFINLRVNGAPGQYQLVARSGGLQATSTPFNVTSPPGVVSLMGVKELAPPTAGSPMAKVNVTYRIDHGDAAQPFIIKLYRARNERFEDNSGNDLALLGSFSVTGALLKQKPGTYRVSIPVKRTDLGIDAERQYVLAVADPDHATSEISPNRTEAHFQIFTLGFVVEGFSPLDSEKYPLAWMTSMAGNLKTYDNYYNALPFVWPSATKGHRADLEGRNLVAMVEAAIREVLANPNDVINLHFVAHSRGCVVISRAVALLLHDKHVAPLQRQYIKMTYLDPHPAATRYELDASENPSLNPLVVLAINRYNSFEQATQDGPVTAPVGVNEVEDVYELTDYSALASDSFEFEKFNMHGLPLRRIDNPGNIKILAYNLTTKLVDGTTGAVIGHSETHDWYDDNVVKAGKVTTGIVIPI